MNINKLTPIADSAVTKIQETIIPPAKAVAKKILNNAEFYPARFDLELNAERLSPEEYIRARRYLSNLEFAEYAKNEMITL